MNGSVGLALLISTLAGLSTMLGSVLGLLIRQPGRRFLAFTLGFCGGVMLLVSFAELLPNDVNEIGFMPTYLAFFGGLLLMFLIDVLVPHEYMGRHDHAAGTHNSQLLKTGLFVALGISMHNLPEGIASFTRTMLDPTLGIAVAAAIALHNIPEGLCVSCPIYAATSSRRRALWSVAFAAAAEPLGALLAAAFLLPFLSPSLLSLVLAGVAGVMVFGTLDELVPVAHSFAQEHISIAGIIAGMMVMTLRLWMLHHA